MLKPIKLIVMNTLVVKGTEFSYNDIERMREVEQYDVQIVMIYLSGSTINIKTSMDVFKECNEDNTSSIIYKTFETSQEDWEKRQLIEMYNLDEDIC